MLLHDALTLHSLIALVGIFVTSAMAIHGLQLANQGRKWLWIWVSVNAVLFVGTAIDGAFQTRDARIGEQEQVISDRARDTRERGLQEDLHRSLANEDELKQQVTELAHQQIERAPARAVIPQAVQSAAIEGARGGSALAAAASLRLSEERVASTDAGAPYGLRVILQTDSSISNPDFVLLCEGDIKRANFFVVGQPVMMAMRQGTLANGCGLRLSFSFPEFTPESPISVMVYSDRPTRFTAVKDVRGMPWRTVPATE